MGKIEDLQQAATDLQSALDAKQDQIATKLAADKQTIADLQAIVDAGNGVTDEQLQGIIEQLTASREDLAATPTD